MGGYEVFVFALERFFWKQLAPNLTFKNFNLLKANPILAFSARIEFFHFFEIICGLMRHQKTESGKCDKTESFFDLHVVFAFDKKEHGTNYKKNLICFSGYLDHKKL